MPSFDIVSEYDYQEIRNAVDQAQKEVSQRYDFKGTDPIIDLGETSININGDTEQRLKAMLTVIEDKFIKRKLSLKILEQGKMEEAAGGRAKQELKLQKGIPSEKAKEIGKFLKGLNLKGIQHQIQGDQLRVTGKKRDDLQAAIAALKENEKDIPLQFVNFRD